LCDSTINTLFKLIEKHKYTFRTRRKTTNSTKLIIKRHVYELSALTTTQRNVKTLLQYLLIKTLNKWKLEYRINVCFDCSQSRGKICHKFVLVLMMSTLITTTAPLLSGFIFIAKKVDYIFLQKMFFSKVWTTELLLFVRTKQRS
jgi:hypothetical protein